MSPRAEFRRTRLSSSTPRDEENPSRVHRLIGLVRKRTGVSNRNTPVTASFFAEWSTSLELFHCAGRAPCSPPQAVYLGHLRRTGQAGSAVRRLLSSCSNTRAGRFARKLFNFHDFSLGVRGRPLTRGRSQRYMALHRGRSRCEASAEMASSCVPGPLMMIGED